MHIKTKYGKSHQWIKKGIGKNSLKGRNFVHRTGEHNETSRQRQNLGSWLNTKQHATWTMGSAGQINLLICTNQLTMICT